MGPRYTIEKNAQILIALLKAHGIKKVIASPGTTNICLVASVQSDPWFEVYSCVDERSAAYMACGMAAESGEPVVISCTGSTAARNYVPALTEAYYRKLPVLAVTSSQHLGRVGQYCGQVTDRSRPLADMVNVSVTMDLPHTAEDEWACALNANKAIIALKRLGGGPAHINLVTSYSRDYSCTKLPDVKVIRYVSGLDELQSNTAQYNTTQSTPPPLPSLEGYKRIAILVGERGKWPPELAEAVDAFCAAWDAVVIASHASNYKGDYGYNPDLINGMRDYTAATEKAELVIYIGGVSRYGSGMREKEMWRVNPDGEIRDFAKTLTRVFQMDEAAFFRLCVEGKEPLKEPGYARKWQEECAAILARADFDAMPFCNVWVARELSMMLPEGSVFHLSGSNTARCWNFFQIPRSVACHSNDGMWGIDGQVSAFIGECLATPDKLHFCAAGDLTFFYDMNSIGNRHVGSNARLLLVNNGGGGEMKLYSHHPASAFGEDGSTYMAALGHFGNKSRELVRHYAEDLGFEYLTASDKQSFLEAAKRFTTTEMTERPMLFEVFTDMEAESAGIYMMNHLVSNIKRLGNLKRLAAGMIRSVAGQKGVDAVKRILKR